MGKGLAFFVMVTLVSGMIGLLFQGAQGGVVTTSTAALTTTAAAVGVSNTDGFPTSGLLVVRNEIIRYTGKSPAGACPAPIPGASPCFTGLTRGIANSDAATHPSGVRVYDKVAGYANLGSQYQTLQVQNEIEQVGRITLNPLTWGNFLDSMLQGGESFLTGDWQIVMLPWTIFTIAFLFSLTLALAGVVRTVFLR